jgi:hypothetical protein
MFRRSVLVLNSSETSFILPQESGDGRAPARGGSREGGRAWTTGATVLFFTDSGFITTGKEKMTRTVILSVCLVACSVSLSAHAQDAPVQNAPSQVAPTQDVRQYSEGPVIEEDLVEVEYGHFEEYIDWLNTVWKPTMKALKKAGLIIDYHVFRATPNSPGQPNVILWIAFKDAQSAFDKDVDFENVTKKVIGTIEFQNKARQFRNGYRTILGNDYLREIILK